VPKITDGYQPTDILKVDETGLFYNLQPSKTLTYKDDSHHGGTKSKQRAIVLLGCNADGTKTLPPLVNGKYNKPYCYRIVKKLPTKHTATSNSWTTSATFEEFLVQLDCQGAAKKHKILLFMDQCVAHPRDNTARKNTEVIFFLPKLHKPFTATGYRDHAYFQMSVQKETHMEGSSSDRRRIIWCCRIT